MNDIRRMFNRHCDCVAPAKLLTALLKRHQVIFDIMYFFHMKTSHT